MGTQWHCSQVRSAHLYWSIFWPTWLIFHRYSSFLFIWCELLCICACWDSCWILCLNFCISLPTIPNQSFIFFRELLDSSYPKILIWVGFIYYLWSRELWLIFMTIWEIWQRSYFILSLNRTWLVLWVPWLHQYWVPSQF